MSALIPYFMLDRKSKREREQRKVRFYFAITLILLFSLIFCCYYYFCRWWFGGGTLFEIEDLWPWLWNSLNTLIFTRAHLTMRYIALFFLSLSYNSVHWNWRPNADLIKSKWKLKRKKNHQNSGAMPLVCITYVNWTWHMKQTKGKKQFMKEAKLRRANIFSSQSGESVLTRTNSWK